MTKMTVRLSCYITIGISQRVEFGAGPPGGCGTDARRDGEACRAALSLAASRTRHTAGVQPPPGTTLCWARVSYQV